MPPDANVYSLWNLSWCGHSAPLKRVRTRFDPERFHKDWRGHKVIAGPELVWLIQRSPEERENSVRFREDPLLRPTEDAYKQGRFDSYPRQSYGGDAWRSGTSGINWQQKQHSHSVVANLSSGTARSSFQIGGTRTGHMCLRREAKPVVVALPV